MKKTKGRLAFWVGILFLLTNAVFIVGVLILEPILGSVDYLTAISENSNQLIFGSLLELANGLAYLGIAVLMFPLLRRRFESLAIWYLAFRIVEYAMQILADLSPLRLLTLVEDHLNSGSAIAASLPSLGALLLSGRFWAFQMVSLTFGLSALAFYYILYQDQLVPRFISIWGLIGATIVLLNLLADMFALNIGNLGVIMLLNELFLGIWLIAKGFNEQAIAEPI